MYMNKKIFAISAVSFLIYSYILLIIGIFGTNIQGLALQYGMLFLKYGLILIGFAATIFLPYRISKALEQRAEEKYQRESDEKIRKIAEEKIRMENQIAEELKKQDNYDDYIKNEDAI